MLWNDSLEVRRDEQGDAEYVFEEYMLQHILEDYIFWTEGFDAKALDVPKPYRVVVKRLDGTEDTILEAE